MFPSDEFFFVWLYFGALIVLGAMFIADGIKDAINRKSSFGIWLGLLFVLFALLFQGHYRYPGGSLYREPEQLIAAILSQDPDMSEMVQIDSILTNEEICRIINDRYLKKMIGFGDNLQIETDLTTHADLSWVSSGLIILVVCILLFTCLFLAIDDGRKHEHSHINKMLSGILDTTSDLKHDITDNMRSLRDAYQRINDRRKLESISRQLSIIRKEQRTYMNLACRRGGTGDEISHEEKMTILDMPISETDLSSRIKTKLIEVGINTIGDLINESYQSLECTRGIGMSSVSEILRMLEKYNLDLKYGPYDEL